MSCILILLFGGIWLLFDLYQVNNTKRIVVYIIKSKNSMGASAFLLILRISFGLLLMNHGIQKWSNFQELSTSFPDPLGLGSPLSLGLAIFAELVCSMAFIIGFLYRLAMIPMIFTMGIAFFVIHANDAFAMKELALVYLIVFILMYISGPGKYSVDYMIGRQLRNKRKM